jgi:hypothetical protein
LNAEEVEVILNAAFAGLSPSNLLELQRPIKSVSYPETILVYII